MEDQAFCSAAPSLWNALLPEDYLKACFGMSPSNSPFQEGLYPAAELPYSVVFGFLLDSYQGKTRSKSALLNLPCVCCKGQCPAEAPGFGLVATVHVQGGVPYVLVDDCRDLFHHAVHWS